MHMAPTTVLLLEGRRNCQFPNSDDLISDTIKSLKVGRKNKDGRETGNTHTFLFGLNTGMNITANNFYI